tara:strand:- start:943 stop:1854 length:912 start_codon:yes stop_codon:yes gene_type:complete
MKYTSLIILIFFFSCSSVEDKKVFDELSIDNGRKLIEIDNSYSKIIDDVSLFYEKNKNQPSKIVRFSSIKLKDLKEFQDFLLDTTNYKVWREEYLKTDNIDILKQADSILNEYRKIYFDWGNNNEYLKTELIGAKNKSLSFKYNFIRKDVSQIIVKAIVYDKETKVKVAFDRGLVFFSDNGKIKKNRLTEYDDAKSLKFKNLEDFLERYILRLELDSEFGGFLNSFKRIKKKQIGYFANSIFKSEFKGYDKYLISSNKKSFIEVNLFKDYLTVSDYLNTKSLKLASQKFPLIFEFYNFLNNKI